MKKLFYLILVLTILTSYTCLAIGPLNGAYTINQLLPASSTNFPTLNAFADSINLNGVSGPVTATITSGSGSYSGKVEFINIPGASAANTVTLDGNGESLTVITNTTDRYAVRLTDIDYFNVVNLRVLRDITSTSGFYGIHIFNTGSNIAIEDCFVDMNGTNSTLVGAYIASGSATSILVEGDFHFITITGCSSEGGGYGASVFGLGVTLATNIQISGCSFTNFHDNGIYLRETNGAIISGNQFDKNNSNITSVNAIQVAQAANINTQIFNNFIQVGQTSNGTVTFRGIYLFNGTGHKVYNNVIHNVNLTSGNFTGIEIRTGGTAPEIYFNTIAVDNPLQSSGDLVGIKEELSNTNAILRNNMISISQPTTGEKAGLVIGATANPATAFNSNYNNIYVPGGHTAIKNLFSPVYYTNMSTWQSVSLQDFNSVVIDPLFPSMQLSIPTNPSLNNLGIPAGGITTDVLGFTRLVTPDIGAYEFIDVGVNEFDNELSVQIHPNPATDHITFTTSFSNSEIIITDMSGKICLKTKMLSAKANIPVKKLANGTYMVTVRSGEKTATGRFIKAE